MSVTRIFVPCATRCGILRAVAASIGAALLVIAGSAAPAVAAPGATRSASAAQALAPPSVFAWGSAIFGQLGNGVAGGLNNPVEADIPVPITLPTSVRQISSGDFSDAALLSNGTVATWGYNLFGALGNGTTTSRDTPAVVPGLTGITQIAAGNHMLALDSSGTVWSWGDNEVGELGNGTTSQVLGSNPTPVPVPGLSGVIEVARGEHDSFALRSDGTVWAWGLNSSGQLGDGTTVNRDVPEQIPGLSGIKAVSAGFATTYAIRADGSVLAWGDNTDGLLGTGTAGGFSATPRPVPGLAAVTQISASGYDALAVAGPAGTVWAWGVNTYGAEGDGTTSPHYTPVQTGLTGVAQVSTYGFNSAAVLSSGSVMTWGRNVMGDLGTGTKDNTLHPTPVLVRTLAGASQVAVGDDDVHVIASPAPRIPNLVGYTQSDAAQVLQAAGYLLGRVSVVVDITCEYIGEIKTQSPAAGTIDPPGTVVNVAIGKAGGKCL